MCQTHARTRSAVHATMLAVLTALVAAPAGVAGQGWIEPLPRTGDWGVVKLGTDVTVTVEGRVAQVVVEEWFENRGSGLGEGDYLYPLPGEAVFSNFSLYQGDEELRGETMDANEARQIYEEIVRRKRDPALIELVGHGLVRARVFPIEPGQRRRITLRYTQVLERAGESVQFRYVAGTRNDGATVRDGTGAVRAPIRFTLTADAGQYAQPFSPTHALDVERRDGRIRVQPTSGLAGDLSLFLPVADAGVGLTLAAHRPAGEDGYFMLTLSPGPSERGGPARDVTAVVDVSGSMSGEKLEQTRAALHQLLGSLRPDDRFRLVAFSNRVRSSSEGWARATDRDLREARRWIDGLRADGGTNIADALVEALRLETPDDRLPIVLFLTDGLPTVGEQDPERIAETAEDGRGRSRIFAFGVGYDVNTYLLDRLGDAGRGSTAYVEPGEDVERAVALLAAKVTHPVLTDLEIAGTPVRLTEVFPGELPDLFAGEELVVFGRYAGDGEGRLRIRGSRGERDVVYGVGADFPGRSEANDFIPRLWASRKLGELTRQIRLHGASDELVEEARRVALRYGLLSEFTSYLVQEPGVVVGGRPVDRLRAGEPRMALDAAASPSAATGAAAVRASKRAEAQRTVASAAELDQAEKSAEEELSGSGMRIVAGRTFQRVEGLWTEVGEPTEEPVSIELYSEAYFAVLRALPELRPVLAEISPVVVHGDAVSLRFDDAGAASLGESELDRLVARFRGSYH